MMTGAEFQKILECIAAREGFLNHQADENLRQAIARLLEDAQEHLDSPPRPPGPQISISEETHRKLVSFQALGHALAEEPMSLDESADQLIVHGLGAIVAGLWQTQEPAVLLATLQQLAAQHSEAVYPFLAQMLTAGSQVQQENARERIGFATPAQSPNVEPSRPE